MRKYWLRSCIWNVRDVGDVPEGPEWSRRAKMARFYVVLCLIVACAAGCTSASVNSEKQAVTPSWVKMYKSPAQHLEERAAQQRVQMFGFDPLKEDYRYDNGNFADYSKYQAKVLKDVEEFGTSGYLRLRVVQFPSGAKILDGYSRDGDVETRRRKFACLSSTGRHSK